VNVQHLSDEAVAAFADGVLTGHARDRATSHTASCPECGYAVAVQREAVWALRTAPPPALPVSLLARLREVPSTTPINVVPTVFAADGSAMFSTFSSMASAAVVAPPTPPRTSRSAGTLRTRLRPVVATAAAVAVAGVVAVGSAAHAVGGQPTPLPDRPAQFVPAVYSGHGGDLGVLAPATVRGVVGR
jgi:hypothetical protein